MYHRLKHLKGILKEFIWGIPKTYALHAKLYRIGSMPYNILSDKKLRTLNLLAYGMTALNAMLHCLAGTA